MKKYSVYFWIMTVLMMSASRICAMENPDLEGWIVKIDTIKSKIRVLSANAEKGKVARDHTVSVKPGMISDFKMNDYVQVTFREDLPYALLIEKSSPKVGQQAKASNAN